MPYVDSSTRSRQIVAAARTAMVRDGVGNTSIRDVAAEAGVPLGTLQHVFPTKEQLLRAVFDDVVDEIADVSPASDDSHSGVAHAIRAGLTSFWTQLVSDQISSQVMQLELLAYAVRNPGEDGLARWLYERYLRVAAEMCCRAATNAGEVCTVSFEQLARLMVAGLDGILLQYMCEPDETRARADLDALIEMVIHIAGIKALTRGDRELGGKGVSGVARRR